MNRISLKLFLVLLGTASLVVLVILLLMQENIGRGFQAYLRQKQRERLLEIAQGLAESYGKQENWDFITHDPRHWRRLLDPQRPEPPAADPHDSPLPWPPPHPPLNAPRNQDRNGRWPAPPPFPLDRPPPSEGRYPRRPPPPLPRRRPAPPPPPLRDAPPDLVRGATLFDGHRQPIIGPESSPVGLLLEPVRVHGETVVGWVGSRPLPAPSSAAEVRFLRSQRQAYLLIGLATLLSAGLAALLLTRRLLGPVQALARAAHRLAGGHFETRVVLQSTDEIGQLAKDFNHLAATLEANEGIRRRWIADISHELRTPLAVLRGEIEALQDGVRPMGTEALQSLHGEVMHLGKLIEDLYQLTLSDLGGLVYRMEPLDPLALLAQVADGFRTRYREAGLGLDWAPPPRSRQLLADPQRLSQLFHNLFENSLRYTARDGRLQIAARYQAGDLVLDWQDSAPGVPATSLPQLFDHLHRGEGSRNRRHGGAGLGLAICRNIVTAHQGTIQARPSPLGGLWIEIHLPLTAGGTEHG